MRSRLQALALILVSILFFQCQKEVGYIGTADNDNNTAQPFTAVLQGNITDETGAAASGVTVRVGTQTATTDARGYFRIRNAALDKRASLVVAEKAGYFKAYRTFSATSGANQVTIKLLKKDLTGTVSASAGGSATLSNGAKVELPAGGIVRASDGSAYSGNVSVYATYIDPTASDIDQTIPGSLMANDKNNNRVTLSSYGMLAVDLESPSGERLQIKTGSTATLTTPIPSSLQSSAPATIALWSVDENTGLWKEEGTATRNGSNYVGNVSHFSFWNCDIGIPAVTVSMTVKNPEGGPLSNVMVRLKRTTGTPSTAYGYTDSLGQVSGLVPSNETILLEVLDRCYNVVYTQNIGPFTSNANAGVITINTSSSLVTVKGKVVNCSNAAVTNGYAIIYLGNTVRYAATDASGNFSVSFLQCATTTSIQVLGVDDGAGQQGSISTVVLAAPVTNTGNLTACGNSTTQFINYTLDGSNYSIVNNSTTDSTTAFTQGVSSSNTFTTFVSGFQMNSGAIGNSISFAFTHAALVAGTYPASRFSAQNYDQTSLVAPFNIVITNFPTTIGQFYEGTFSGTFTQNGSHTVSGSFRVRRNF